MTAARARPTPPRRAASLPPKDMLRAQLRAAPGLSPDQVETLFAYCRLIAHWNQAYSLIGANTLPEIVPVHILNALCMADFLPPAAKNFLDVGTGAGLPGLPLAIARPECSFTLLDRSRKKTRFVEQAVLELELSNVEVVTAQAERYQGGPFDCIFARAVGTIAEVVGAGAHLLSPQGVFLLPKGPDIEPELQELLPGWDGEVLKVKEESRTFVMLRPQAVERCA